ncbi:MAG: glutathione S-transferase N-terminal domain-containing protein [Gammaproteobacteria bacterium]|nr:glutathione S-transferase N-terminal domain-containing protein [Gammaproteobacteria bacterium]
MLGDNPKAAIDFYYWPTPNGWKVAILLEELGLEYRVIPVNIAMGDQFTAAFTRLSPNQKIPAIYDHQPGFRSAEGGFPLFESGAILAYLAEKVGQFIPDDPSGRWQCLQWVFWQVGGLGPMGGQAHHFRRYASQDIPYARDRYTKECQRLYAVLNRQLQDRPYLCGDYSIADMACIPWIYRHEWQGIDLAQYPQLHGWYDTLMAREAVQAAFALGEGWRGENDFQSDVAREVLFGSDRNRAGDGQTEEEEK